MYAFRDLHAICVFNTFVCSPLQRLERTGCYSGTSAVPMTTRASGANLPQQTPAGSQQLDRIATFAIELGALGPRLAHLAEDLLATP